MLGELWKFAFRRSDIDIIGSTSIGRGRHIVDVFVTRRFPAATPEVEHSADVPPFARASTRDRTSGFLIVDVLGIDIFKIFWELAKTPNV